jgi:hypothetical protein
VKLTNNEPPDLPQMLADEFTFIIAKFRLLYGMPATSIIGVLTILINELVKSNWDKPPSEDDDEIDFTRN